jgi:hypothetical protein
VQTIDPARQTLDSGVQTVHSAVQTIHFAVQTVHFAPQSLHFAVQTVHSGVQTVHFAPKHCNPRLKPTNLAMRLQKLLPRQFFCVRIRGHQGVSAFNAGLAPVPAKAGINNESLTIFHDRDVKTFNR